MIKISKKELNDLRKSNKRVLKTVKFKVGTNPARKWYKYKNPIKQAKNYFIVLICKILPPCEFKNSLYKLIGVKIGKNVSIANDSIIDPIFPELIKIEDNVIIGWGAKLFTHEFTLDTFRVGSIIIQRNSMIGEYSVIRP
jgi:acetyltransferase-like isoleucine patch superfamily enzyme